LHPEVPKELEAVVLKALAKDPALRYQTAQEFDQAVLEAMSALQWRAAPAEHADVAAPVVAGVPGDALAEQPPAPAAAAAVQDEPADPAAASPPPAAEAEAPEAEVPVMKEPPGRRVESTVPPASPAPVFLTAANAPAASIPLLLYSGAAAVCVGVVVMVFWLVGK
jgi:hypothetical protein